MSSNGQTMAFAFAMKQGDSGVGGAQGTQPANMVLKSTDDSFLHTNQPIAAVSSSTYTSTLTDAPTSSAIAGGIVMSEVLSSSAEVAPETKAAQVAASVSSPATGGIASQTAIETPVYTSINTEITSTATVISASPSPSQIISPISQQPQSSAHSHTNSQAQTVGIVVGILALLVIVFIGVAFFLRRHREKAVAIDEMIEQKPLPYFAYPPPLTSAETRDPFGDEHAICPGGQSISSVEQETRGIGIFTPCRSDLPRPNPTNGLCANSSPSTVTEETGSTSPSTSRDSSSTPTHRVVQVARPFSGASIVTVSPLPSYEESQSHASGIGSQRCARSAQLGQDSMLNDPVFWPSALGDFPHDDLEAEYEAEAARMAGFGVPARRLVSERESARRVSDEAGGLGEFRRTSRGSWSWDTKRASGGAVSDES